MTDRTVTTPPNGNTPDLAAAQAAATQLGTQYTDPNLTGEQREQLRAEIAQASAATDRVEQISPDGHKLLTRSVTTSLRIVVEGEQ